MASPAPPRETIRLGTKPRNRVCSTCLHVTATARPKWQSTPSASNPVGEQPRRRASIQGVGHIDRVPVFLNQLLPQYGLVSSRRYGMVPIRVNYPPRL